MADDRKLFVAALRAAIGETQMVACDCWSAMVNEGHETTEIDQAIRRLDRARGHLEVARRHV